MCEVCENNQAIFISCNYCNVFNSNQFICIECHNDNCNARDTSEGWRLN